MAFSYYVFVMTNCSQSLYLGVTNNVYRRLEEHRAAKPGSFTAKYHIDRLIYVEETNSIEDALNREKQLKGWSRQKKMALIIEQNLRWRDLSEGFTDRPRDTSTARN